MSAAKTYWIGDDGDNKSVLIDRKVYTRGDEIPSDKVDKDVLKAWDSEGLISVGEKRVPILVTNKGQVQKLEAEIRDLNAKLDSLPGLEKQNEELKTALEKAKTGKKADAVKGLEDRVKELETDNEKLTADLDAATAPDNSNKKPDDIGAGPGVSEKDKDANAGPGGN